MFGDYEERDKNDRVKKSWRDIDNSGKRSRHVSQDPVAPRSTHQAYNEKRQENEAKKALEQFFQGKKSKEQELEWKKVLDGSPKNFSTRASNYVTKHGLPREWDDLLRLLDHREPVFLGTVLDKLEHFVPNETNARLDVLVGKLRILKMTCEDDPLIARMEKLIGELSAKL
jgi:hypothetical protein